MNRKKTKKKERKQKDFGITRIGLQPFNELLIANIFINAKLLLHNRPPARPVGVLDRNMRGILSNCPHYSTKD